MISFPEGTTFPISFIATDINGNIISLAGATVVTMNVYYRPREASVAVLTKTLSDDVDITGDGTAGAFVVTVQDDDGLLEGEYSFDVKATLADSSVVGIGRGEIDVTHFDSLES